MARFLGILLVACFVSTVIAQDQIDEPEKLSDEQRARHLAEMKDVATSIRLLADARESDSEVKLLKDPVLRYSDNTRFAPESALWLWSSGGRPTAVLAVEHYPKHRKGPRWLYEVASLSPKLITVERQPELNWTAKEPGLKLQMLPESDPPAETPTRRLLQMKQIARRFTAHETAVIEGRVELRLMSSPLHRYSDTDLGVTDGALFVYAYGTNPEAMLVLEAHSEKGAASAWKYGLAQLTGGEIIVELDAKEVWHQQEADPPAVRDSYVNGWIPAKKIE